MIYQHNDVGTDSIWPLLDIFDPISLSPRG
jgi:hypothetical protein